MNLIKMMEGWVAVSKIILEVFVRRRRVRVGMMGMVKAEGKRKELWDNDV